jgi:hypothetical protein
VVKVLGGSIEKELPDFYNSLQRASIVPKKQMYAQIITSSLPLVLEDLPV